MKRVVFWTGVVAFLYSLLLVGLLARFLIKASPAPLLVWQHLSAFLKVGILFEAIVGFALLTGSVGVLRRRRWGRKLSVAVFLAAIPYRAGELALGMAGVQDAGTDVTSAVVSLLIAAAFLSVLLHPDARRHSDR